MIDSLKKSELGMNVQNAQTHLDNMERDKTDNSNRITDYRLKRETFNLELDALKDLDYESLPSELRHKMLDLESDSKQLDGMIKINQDEHIALNHKINMANTNLTRHRNSYSDYVNKDNLKLTSIDKEFMRNNTLGSMSTEKVSEMIGKYGSHQAFMADARLV